MATVRRAGSYLRLTERRGFYRIETEAAVRDCLFHSLCLCAAVCYHKKAQWSNDMTPSMQFPAGFRRRVGDRGSVPS